jgi:hypothetical protein
MRFANTIGSRKDFSPGSRRGIAAQAPRARVVNPKLPALQEGRCCTSPAVLRFSDDDGLPCPTTQCRRAVRSCPGGKLSNAELERNALCRQCPADSESVKRRGHVLLHIAHAAVNEHHAVLNQDGSRQRAQIFHGVGLEQSARAFERMQPRARRTAAAG